MTGAAGPPRVAVTALGCKVNFAEMAELTGRLAAAGFDVVPDGEHAEIRVLNSCTVTLQADATTRQRLSRLRRRDPDCHLVLTGCSVDANPGRYDGGSVAGVDAVFANADKSRISDHLIAWASARGELTRRPPARPALRTRAFLKVQDGCDHRCTYCIVSRVRGPSRSLPVEAVLRRAGEALEAGHRELVLTGVDLGSYGRGHDADLAVLVGTLLDRIGDARLRLSSVNANDITPRLAELTGHPRFCPHWHIPLQSGSDRVLRAMHRGYRMAQYRRVVAGIRDANAATQLTTDLITAFPGETDEDHRRTLDAVEEMGFLHCHVFRHSPRPGTASTGLAGAVDEAVARRRSVELRRRASAAGLAARRRAVGQIAEVLWEEVEEGAARGLSETWLAVTAPPAQGVATGLLSRVRVEAATDDGVSAVPLPAPVRGHRRPRPASRAGIAERHPPGAGAGRTATGNP